MDVISTYKFARVSAQKARDVAREIQGLPVSAALDILTFTPRKSAFLIGKVVKTAIADAENNFELAVDTLFVKEASVGEGPTFKRFQPRARGSAGAIRKRTSHIRIVLSQIAEAGGEAMDEGAETEEAPEAETQVPKKKTPAGAKKKAAAKERVAAAAK